MPSQPNRPALPDVWIVNHYAGPPSHGGGTRHHDLALQLHRRGHAVTIFASAFNHSGGRHEDVGRMRLYRTERVGGIRYVWIRCGSYRGNSIGRVLNMVEFSVLAVMVQAHLRRPGVVIGSTVHPLAALAGYVISRLRRARFFFEIRDLWPQTLIDLGAMSERSLAARGLRMVEAFLVTHSAAVITLLQGTGDYLAERNLQPRRLLYLPNGVDLSAVRGAKLTSEGLPEYLAAWRKAGTWVCVYLGAHGRANGLGVVVTAAAILQRQSNNRVRLVLVGDGPEKPELMERASALGLENLYFADIVPKDKVPALLSMVDAGLAHYLRTPVHRYGISFNKLFDYMANSKPVIFACDTAYDPVADYGAGMSIPPEDPVALAAAIDRMSGLPSVELEAMGARGYEYVRLNHDIEMLGAQLDDLLTGAQ
jgi:glycosyltransferase involved in cell wall biosynthesis